MLALTRKRGGPCNQQQYRDHRLKNKGRSDQTWNYGTEKMFRYTVRKCLFRFRKENQEAISLDGIEALKGIMRKTIGGC